MTSQPCAIRWSTSRPWSNDVAREQAEMDEIFTYIDARDAAYCLLSEGCCPLTESEARDLRELAQREEAEIRSAIVLLKTQELALAHSCVEVAC